MARRTVVTHLLNGSLLKENVWKAANMYGVLYIPSAQSSCMSSGMHARFRGLSMFVFLLSLTATRTQTLPLAIRPSTHISK